MWDLEIPHPRDREGFDHRIPIAVWLLEEPNRSRLEAAPSWSGSIIDPRPLEGLLQQPALLGISFEVNNGL